LRKWLVIYADAPQRSVEVAQGESDARVDFLFDAAAARGDVDGRGIHGMWLLDPATAEEDVLGTYGLVPVNVRDRITARTRCHRKPPR